MQYNSTLMKCWISLLMGVCSLSVLIARPAICPMSVLSAVRHTTAVQDPSGQLVPKKAKFCHKKTQKTHKKPQETHTAHNPRPQKQRKKIAAAATIGSDRAHDFFFMINVVFARFFCSQSKWPQGKKRRRTFYCYHSMIRFWTFCHKNLPQHHNTTTLFRRGREGGTGERPWQHNCTRLSNKGNGLFMHHDNNSNNATINYHHQQNLNIRPRF